MDNRGKEHTEENDGLHEEDGKLFAGDLKTKAARRTIKLSEKAITALRRQKKLQSEAKMKVGPAWSPPPSGQRILKRPCFHKRHRGLLYRSHIGQRDLRRIVKRVSVMRLADKLDLTPDQLTACNPFLLWKKPLSRDEEIRLPDGRTYKVEDADIMPPVTLHTFRHTCTSLLIFEGVDIKVSCPPSSGTDAMDRALSAL